MAKASGNQGQRTAPAGGTQDEAKVAPPADSGGEFGNVNGSESSGPVLQKKLSVKTIAGDLKAQILDPNNETRLVLPAAICTMMGVANGIEDGMSNFGAWSALVGDFECVNLLTGEIHIGSKLFIPEPAGKILVEQVRAFITAPIPLTAEEKSKPTTQQVQRYQFTGEKVEFALEIWAKLNPKSTGAPYEYETRPLVQVQRSDQLQALRAIVLAKGTRPAQKRLAAPAV